MSCKSDRIFYCNDSFYSIDCILNYNNNLVQYRVIRCYCLINPLIGVPPLTNYYIYGDCRLVITLFIFALLNFFQSGVKKLLAWRGIELTTLDLRSQSGAYDLSAATPTPKCVGEHRILKKRINTELFIDLK